MVDNWHLISWNYGDVDDSEQQSIDSPGHSEYNAQSVCSEMDGFAERSFEVQFVPDAAVEKMDEFMLTRRVMVVVRRWGRWGSS